MNLAKNTHILFSPGGGEGPEVHELPPDRDGQHGLLPGGLSAVREAAAQINLEMWRE